MNEIDPTICQRCGANETQEAVAALHVCSECAGIMNDYPFPRWLKIAAAGLALLVVFSMAWNLRFLRAIHEYKNCNAAFAEGNVDEAELYATAAFALVPESDDLKTAVAFYRGVIAMRDGNYAEAIELFKEVDTEPQLGTMLWVFTRRVMIGKAFDDKDYDTFLSLSKENAELCPDEAFEQAGVASAYACKFAVTGSPEFREQAMDTLEKARALVEGDDPHWTEYEQRILHRLDSREIISRDEFVKRFPDGWTAQKEVAQ